MKNTSNFQKEKNISHEKTLHFIHHYFYLLVVVILFFIVFFIATIYYFINTSHTGINQNTQHQSLNDKDFGYDPNMVLPPKEDE